MSEHANPRANDLNVPRYPRLLLVAAIVYVLWILFLILIATRVVS